jgi:hypothetical protein
MNGKQNKKRFGFCFLSARRRELVDAAGVESVVASLPFEPAKTAG